MFEVLYLFVLVWATLPLVRTLMQGRGGDHIAFVHRLYRDAAYILVAGLGIIVFEAALGISLENYWFEELGQSHRYWLSLEYRVAIFLVVLLSVGVFIGVNLRALCRSYAVIPASAPWIVGFVLAALVGFFATPLWIPLMRFLGATSAGVVDPVFGRDLSFYLLALPLYDVVVDIVIGVLCLAIALWVGIGLAARSGTAAFVNRPAPGRPFDRYGSVALLSPGPNQADWATWIRQGMTSRCTVVHRTRDESIFGPLSPRCGRTLEGRGRRLLCRRQFLATWIRPHRGMLVRGRVDPWAGGCPSARLQLVVDATVALARAVGGAGAARRRSIRGSHRD